MDDTPKSFEGIMVSSTFTDLKAHRQEVIDAISRLGFHPVGMEYSGASDADVLTKSLQMVTDCAVYVLIISRKYGQIPADPRNSNKVSITELEFEHAVSLGRPRLLFLIADDHPELDGDKDATAASRKKLETFKKRAKQARPNDTTTKVHCVWEPFASKEALGKAAAIAVANYALARAARHSAPESQLSGADVAALLEAVRGAARQRSVGTEPLIALARRIAENVPDLAVAEAELHRALDEFAALRARAAQGSNLGDLVDETMRALAAHNERGDLDAGVRAIEQGIAVLREREAEVKAAQGRLIDAAIEQHRLRFDAAEVAKWLCEKLRAEQSALTAPALFPLIQVWREAGQQRGLRFELIVACALADEALQIAMGDCERAAALNWINLTSLDLGEFSGGESGTILIDRAIGASKESIELWTGTDHVFEFAGAQNNLCVALRLKADRSAPEIRVNLFQQARAAGQAALSVWTKECNPGDWASAHNNLATIFQTQALNAPYPECAILIDRAISGYEHTLMVWTKACHPFEWGTAKDNLGIVLAMKGERMANLLGKPLFDRAICEFKYALEVRLQSTWPAYWAKTRENMARCYVAIAQRSPDPLPHWRAAKAAVTDALRVYTPEQMGFYHEKATRLLGQIRAEIAKLGG